MEEMKPDFDEQVKEKNFLKENSDMIPHTPTQDNIVDLSTQSIFGKTELENYIQKPIPQKDIENYDVEFGEDDFVDALWLEGDLPKVNNDPLEIKSLPGEKDFDFKKSSSKLVGKKKDEKKITDRKKEEKKNHTNATDMAIGVIDSLNKSFGDLYNIVTPKSLEMEAPKNYYADLFDRDINDIEKVTGEFVTLLGGSLAGAPLALKAQSYVKTHKYLDLLTDSMSLGAYASNVVKNSVGLQAAYSTMAAELALLLGPNTDIGTIGEILSGFGIDFDLFVRENDDSDLKKLGDVYGNLLLEEHIGGLVFIAGKSIYKAITNSKGVKPPVKPTDTKTETTVKKDTDSKVNLETIDNSVHSISSKISESKLKLKELISGKVPTKEDVVGIIDKMKQKLTKSNDEKRITLANMIRKKLALVKHKSDSRKGDIEKLENYKLPKKSPYDRRIFDDPKFINKVFYSDVYELMRSNVSSAIMKNNGLRDFVDSTAIIHGLEESFSYLTKKYGKQIQKAIDDGVSADGMGLMVKKYEAEISKEFDRRMKTGDPAVIELLREKTMLFEGKNMKYKLPRPEDIYIAEPDLNSMYKSARLDFDSIMKKIRNKDQFAPTEMVDILRSLYNVSSNLHMKHGSYRQAESILEKLEYLEENLHDTGVIEYLFKKISGKNDAKKMKNISNTYSTITEESREKMIKKMSRSTISDIFFEDIIPSLLSGILTQTRNVASNINRMLFSISDELIALPIGKARSSKSAQAAKSWMNKNNEQIRAVLDSQVVMRRIVKKEKEAVSVKQSLIDRLSQYDDIKSEQTMQSVLDRSESELRLFKLTHEDEKILRSIINSDPKNAAKNFDEIKEQLKVQGKRSKSEILKGKLGKIREAVDGKKRHRRKEKAAKQKELNPYPADNMNISAQQILSQIKSIPQGVREAASFSWETLSTGKIHTSFNKLDDVHGRHLTASYLGIDETSNIGIILDHTFDWGVRGPGRVLLAADDFSKAVLFRMNLARLYESDIEHSILVQGLTREEAIVKANRKMLDPPKHWYNSSMEYAKRGTYTEDLGRFGAGFNKFRMRYTLIKLSTLFYRTTMNIWKQGMFERTPLALATPTFYRKAKQNTGEGNTAIGKLLSGTALLSYYFYENSATRDQVMTGAGTIDYGVNDVSMTGAVLTNYKKQNMKNQYQLPMSFVRNVEPSPLSLIFNVDDLDPQSAELMIAMSQDPDYEGRVVVDGKKAFFDISGIEPLATMHGFSMLLVDAYNNIDDDMLLEEVTLKFAEDFVAFGLDRMYLGGILQMGDLRSNPAGFFGDLIHNYSNAVIPLAGLRNTFKSNIKDYKSDTSPGNPEGGLIEAEVDRNLSNMQDNLPPGFSHGIAYMRKIYSGVEGMNTDLPNKTSIWGDDIEYTKSGYQSWVPVNYQVKSQHPVDIEMVRLDMVKSRPKRVIYGASGDIKLNPHQYYSMTKFIHKKVKVDGLIMKEYLRKLIKGNLYKSLSDEQKESNISNIIQKFNKAGKNLFLEEEENFSLRERYYHIIFKGE